MITESNKLGENENFSTPGKTRNRIKKKVNTDNFQRSALRNIVYNFHIKQSSADIEKPITRFKN